jgi:hypothetical protein
VVAAYVKTRIKVHVTLKIDTNISANKAIVTTL